MTSLNQRLAEAVDLFVMTKFDPCFSVCKNVIKTAKCEPEQERNCDVIEAATALGIQALAETDLWHQVVAFITDVYGTVDLCPPRIIQVCILLHAHVKEYLPCHKMVQTWLRNPHNLNHKQCSQVIRVYAHHILCPTGSYDALKEIVQSCTALSETERSALLELPQAGRYEDAKKENSDPDCDAMDLETLTHRHTSAASDSNDPNYIQDSSITSSFPWQESNGEFSGDYRIRPTHESASVKETKSQGPVALNEVCKKFYSIFLMAMNKLRHQGFVICLMGVLAFWGLIQTQTGDPVSSLSRLVVLWRVFLQRLQSFIR